MVQFDLTPNYFAKSNLEQIQSNSFKGNLNKDPEFLISNRITDQITTQIDGQNIQIDFGYALTNTTSLY